MLVGTTHDKFAYQANDVLVEYYADWCPHCKTLAPIWSQLADELTDVSGLKFAKMLATDNETKYFGVSGYPAIALYSADLAFGEPPKTISARSYDGLMEEIKKTDSYQRARGFTPADL